MNDSTPTWANPWGVEDDDMPPDRIEIFPPLNTDGWSSTLGIEGFLQHNDVFRNGISNRPSHCDSYMTVVDFARLTAMVDLLVETYDPPKSSWQHLVDKWLRDPNTQIPLRVVAFSLIDKFQLVPAVKGKLYNS